ncbi:hypothetical protein QQ008_17620 [Fulvivirgaceae bacterium BMA10]|uniref:Carboxypeptidase regulatory-like domain-containing protein n=1 Tax=Splendidivirga corallicola TaxID=3051826 RepID=A0ABT8KSN9_9BACT|nr:hypothetical protein [Fulvivirgaceae bacterium BMA10]
MYFNFNHWNRNPDRRIYQYFLLAPLFCFIACSFERRIPLGIYEEFVGFDMALFESEELLFKENGRFEYFFHSDDLGSSRYGSGIYFEKNHKLYLEFKEGKLPVSLAIKNNQKVVGDTLVYGFKTIYLSKHNDSICISAVNITVYCKNGSLHQTISDDSGSATLKIPAKALPIKLRVEHAGFNALREDIEPISTKYKIILNPAYGATIQAGSTMEFDILKIGSNHIKLKRDRKKIKFVRSYK